MRRKLLLIAVVCCVCAGAFVYLYVRRGLVETDDAYVAGRIHLVTPRVEGYVLEVLVQDNELVQTGQPLVRLDPANYEVALAEARAALASLELGVPLERGQTALRVTGVQAQMEGLDQNLERLGKEEQAAEQERQRAASQHEFAVLELSRMRRLSQARVVSQSALDGAETLARSSLAELEAAKARIEAVQKQRAALSADADRLKAERGLAATGEDQAIIKARAVEAQQARVRQAELDLTYTVVKAPVRGQVTKKGIEPGQMVSQGQPLLAVVPLDPPDIWIVANYKETDLTDVRPGQPARVRVDAYPSLRLNARVESIMAGTGAVFSLFPPENASGNYVKVVQRIPVKLVLEDYDRTRSPTLRLGMSVVPTIDTREDRQ